MNIIKITKIQSGIQISNKVHMMYIAKQETNI